MFNRILNLLGIARNKKPSVRVLGVYEVRGKSYCLMEILIKGSKGPFDMKQFTQEWPTVPRDQWPQPYMSKFLNKDGTEITGDVTLDESTDSSLWVGDIRICFFFHFPAYDLPLITPWGIASLPAERLRPKRLHMIRYKQKE